MGFDAEALTLDALRREDMEDVLIWRHQARAGLRTPFFLTQEMQAYFYDDVVCNRSAPHRYWALRSQIRPSFFGMAGLTNIEWENRLAQISLVTSGDPGIGRAAVRLILDEAFQRMALLTVYGECYSCNPAGGFWQKMVKEFGGSVVLLPRRKWWDGRLWGSIYFTFPAP